MNAVTRVVRSLATVGPKRTAYLVRRRLFPGSHLTEEVLVPPRMLRDIDWTVAPAFATAPRKVQGSPVKVAWISSPPSPASGGHQNLFRFIKAMETAGYECTVYFWDWQGSRIDGDALRTMLAPISAYPDLDAAFLPYEGAVSRDTDAIIATAWETAYASFLDPSPARRFYFVQDFEPWFYPAGPNAVLAENTYRFGFHGLTAGGWLSHHLSQSYGMSADHFDFSADTTMYRVTRQQDRPGVFFYARPETPRRAYALGVAILERVHELAPEIPLHFAGSARKDDGLLLPIVDHGAVDLTRLNDIYNECSAALVLSLSNMSLLPLELIAAGVVPVVNDAANNRMVSENPFIDYQPLVIERMATALVYHATRARPAVEFDQMTASVAGTTWEDSGRQFVGHFARALARPTEGNAE